MQVQLMPTKYFRVYGLLVEHVQTENVVML
jgi:hypothetical protein